MGLGQRGENRQRNLILVQVGFAAPFDAFDEREKERGRGGWGGGRGKRHLLMVGAARTTHNKKSVTARALP